MSDTIRQLFSTRRPIDRTIEKVIDYYAQEEDRLFREVDEYEITDNKSGMMAGESCPALLGAISVSL